MLEKQGIEGKKYKYEMLFSKWVDEISIQIYLYVYQKSHRDIVMHHRNYNLQKVLCDSSIDVSS